MIKRPDTRGQRIKRHKRVRAKISGTAECPRLNVFRSLNHIYAQVIDDVKGVTIAAASSAEKDFGIATGKEFAKCVLGIVGSSMNEAIKKYYKKSNRKKYTPYSCNQ